VKVDLPYIIVLSLLIIISIIWLGTLIFGALTLHWHGVIIIAIIGLLLAVFVPILTQRLRNKEDNYYSKIIKR
jgi:hypothetical protein